MKNGKRGLLYIMENYSLQEYEAILREEEKSANTISKYLRDVSGFLEYCGNREITKDVVIDWKRSISANYKPRSVNSMIASVNSYLKYSRRPDLAVKSMRLQKTVYRADTEELTREEYFRLVEAAEKRPRLQLILQTLCATGIRVSELNSFTVEAVRSGNITISNKGKIRKILMPNRLREMLLDYACKKRIVSGPIFITLRGEIVGRSEVWSDLKSLCKKANVDKRKVYPHNLRKLFAREFYAIDKDIAKLADVLGHSSIETTRTYYDKQVIMLRGSLYPL